MRKKTNHTRIILGAVAVVALMGGNAFTASNTFNADATVESTGYGETVVSGATVNSLSYTLSAAGDNVDSVTLVLAGDTTLSAVSIGFNDGSTTSCGNGAFAVDETTYTCDNGGASFTQSTADLVKTAVVIN